MSSLYTHVISHQAAFRRLSFQHSLKRTTYPLQRVPFPSPRPLQVRIRHSSTHVPPNSLRVAAAAVGAGLAGAGLGLSFYANSSKLNCERPREDSHCTL